MGNREIVEELARKKAVERIVQSIAHRPLTPELEDLSQMVYQIILEYPEDKVLDLWENGQIGFFIARVVLNQYRSASSPYYYQYLRFARNTGKLEDRPDEEA